MATKWAIATGNWNAGATWNDGSVPTADDEVYFNGFQITLNNFNLSVKKISNAICPGTGNQGGKLYYSGNSNIILSAETFEQYAAETLMDIRQTANNNSLTISATKVINQNGYFLYTNSTWGILLSLNVGTFEIGSIAPIYYNYYHVNHTISITNSQIIYSGVNRELIGTVSLNNIITKITIISAADNFYLGINFNATTFTFNGIKVALLRNFTATTSNISGIVNANGHLLISTTINISGGIEYQGSDIGVRYTTLNILNPDTFTWKDVTQPRSNPFIILTDAEMNNRQQYPPENEVKEGTEYVWGEKVGTYQQPPESVVLKGFRYDNEDKVGTLENEVTVDSRNTINVYPYKRRRNG